MLRRPVFLNLWKIKLPLAAFVSIKHRLSGVFLFLMFPLLLYMYALLPLAKELSLFVDQWWVKICLWLLISAFVYHFFAGLRHLMFDFGSRHSLRWIKGSAVLLLLISVGFMVWAACLIWGSLCVGG